MDHCKHSDPPGKQSTCKVVTEQLRAHYNSYTEKILRSLILIINGRDVVFDRFPT